MKQHLRMGITPCPNDTFLAGAMALGQVAAEGLNVDIELADIEALNHAALRGEFDVVKISCALYAHLEADYALLEVGAAVVDGYGPLVLARTPWNEGTLEGARVAAPGRHTTGAALFRLWAPTASALTFDRYDRLMPGLVDGRWDAAVVIHEARLTYRSLGLHCLVDLGDWWTRTTGLPVALGCYVMRRGLYARHGAALEAALREAMRRAAAGEPAIQAWIAQHAQEMNPEVLREYIALYVTPRTWQLDAPGRAAILNLARRLRVDAAA